MDNLAPKPPSGSLPRNKAAVNLALGSQNTQAKWKATKTPKSIIEIGSFTKTTPAVAAGMSGEPSCFTRDTMYKVRSGHYPPPASQHLKPLVSLYSHLSQHWEAQDESSKEGLASVHTPIPSLSGRD